ncbi:MAG: replication initiation protein [Candidatus Kapabacteria bacterium]|jgi:hypothetical protein|nr:replication initiation protein [Candidatus Kapabacteria bacterium]
MSDIVIVSSAAVALEAKHPLSLKALQTYLVLLHRAYDSLLTADMHRMMVQDIVQHLDHKLKGYDELEEAMERLRTTAVRWNILGKVKGIRMTSSLVAEYGFDMDNRQLLWSYPMALRELLYKPKMYTKFTLNEIAAIDNKPQLRLHQLLKDYQGNAAGTGWMSLQQFQDIMGTRYDRWDNIKRYLIDMPLKVINATPHYSYTATYSVRKEGRKTSHLRFDITQKTSPEIGGQNLVTSNLNAPKTGKISASKDLGKKRHNSAPTKAQQRLLLPTEPAQPLGAEKPLIVIPSMQEEQADTQAVYDSFYQALSEGEQRFVQSEAAKRIPTFVIELVQAGDKSVTQIMPFLESEARNETLRAMYPEAFTLTT